MNIICRLFVVAIIMGLLAACSLFSASKPDHTEALNASVATYRKHIRWGYFDEAAKYLRTRDGKPVQADLAHAARYRVTGYTITDQLVADTGTEARVIALIEYYEIDSGVIHSLHDEQLWWYDVKTEHWYLASPLPAFGQGDAAPAVSPAASSPGR